MEIRDARPEELDELRRLLREYERATGVDLAYQGFADELARLPDGYDAFLVAEAGGALAGCVGLRALGGGDCELKRLYVVPAARGTGLGRRLAETAIERARALGHRRLLLDTLPTMREAQALYRRLGFVETEPYGGPALPGTVFFALDLTQASSSDRR